MAAFELLYQICIFGKKHMALKVRNIYYLVLYRILPSPGLDDDSEYMGGYNLGDSMKGTKKALEESTDNNKSFTSNVT